MCRIFLRNPQPMTHLNRFLGTVLAGILGLSLVSPSQASYVTESTSVTLQQTTTDFSKSLALPTFNSSLGTLTNIVVTYTDSGTMQGFVQNTSNSKQSFQVTETSVDSLTYGTTSLLTNNLVALQSYTSLGADQSQQFGIATPSGSAGPMMISSGPLFNAFLEPNSNVMLTFSTLTSTTVTGGGGNISTGIYTTVGATVTVVFGYTPFAAVPEPSSLVLTAIGGFVLIGGLSRSRRNRPRSRDTL
jgi:hypothetical protein